MKPTGAEPRERILQAAAELLQEKRDPGRVTVRQIAARAGVGVGLINYHFQSKQNLLGQAFGRILQEQLRPELEARQAGGSSLARLRLLARRAGVIALAQPGLARLAPLGVDAALLNGRLEPAQTILPILRDHYGARKTELEVRALALALSAALQVAFLHPDEAAAFVGFDPRDRLGLAALADLVIDQVLGEEERKLKWKT